jgi:hypothetical protein
LGSFETPRVIDQDQDSNRLRFDSLVLADLDGDGDQDLLAVSSYHSHLVWYRNVDGQGTFSDQIVVTCESPRTTSISAVDLDRDGDRDIVTSTLGDHSIAWYRNVGGELLFGSKAVIASHAISPSAVAVADLDADGDLDILAAEFPNPRMRESRGTSIGR